MIQAIPASYIAWTGFGFFVLAFMAARVDEYGIALCFALCMAVCVELSMLVL